MLTKEPTGKPSASPLVSGSTVTGTPPTPQGVSGDPITTVTVNQWHIKENVEREARGLDPLPVICVHSYACRNSDGTWGERISGPHHFYELDTPEAQVIYDPVNKTPCGASCWMQFVGVVDPDVLTGTDHPDRN